MDEMMLDEKLNDLKRHVDDALRSTKNRGLQMKNIWSEIREIGKEFKESRFSTAQARQESWEKFQSTVHRVKEEQENYFKSKIKKSDNSQEVLTEIVGLAKQAWPHLDGFTQFLTAISGADVIAGIIMAGLELAVDVMTFGLLRPHPTKDARRDELEVYSSYMKKSWALFKDNKDKMTKEHRDAAWKILSGIQGELDKEWASWKSEKQERRKNWEELREKFENNEISKRSLISQMRNLVGRHDSNDSRTKAKELFQEWRSIKSAGKEKDDDLWKEFSSLNDEFWEQSKTSFKEKQKEHAEKEIEKLEEMLDKAVFNLAANQERLENARTDEYADRVRGWIDENEAFIEKVKTWLEEWRYKLRNL